MKLVSKTLIYYLIISLPLLFIAGLFSYYLIRAELREGTDEILVNESFDAEKLIISFKEPRNMYLSYDSLSYIKIENPHPYRYIFSDTSIYNNGEKEFEGYRMLTTYYTINDKTYLINISKTTLEEEELMEGLFSAFGLIILFLILAFFLMNWFLSKTLWKPFYKTLEVLNKYDIKQHNVYSFEKSTTSEFDRLNNELNKMTDKIYSDFIRQKEFTENASHEMQTPLAIIKANLSLLIQSPNIKEEEMDRLQAIENTLKKLTALNKALILLSKIENNQFNENADVNIKEKVERSISNFNELTLIKNIKIETEFNNDLIVSINPALAEILITNLLQNAIRHNYDNGIIKVSINANSFTVSNKGGPLSIDKEELFTRFKKNDASKESLGLGLSIVKSITVFYNINIQYTFLSGMHTFILIF